MIIKKIKEIIEKKVTSRVLKKGIIIRKPIIRANNSNLYEIG